MKYDRYGRAEIDSEHLHGGASGIGGTVCAHHGHRRYDGDCPCPGCVQDREKKAEKYTAEKAAYSAEQDAKFASAILLIEAGQVHEVEMYLNYEKGIMVWVPVAKFLKDAPKAVFLKGEVWTYPNGNTLRWR